MPRNKFIIKALTVILLLLMTAVFTSCYHRHASTPVFAHSARSNADSLSFAASHHYSNGYNFVVKSDSLMLIEQQPEELFNNMLVDSFYVSKGCHLVVADIRMEPQDTKDSVWIQLATEKQRFGWTHEKYMLAKVVPDDPISMFISFFSDVHLQIFLVIIVVISAVYLLRKVSRKNGKIVHLNDIDSIYPTLLCLLVAFSATLYASIQLFLPELWQQFYFHPTLNPFSVSPIMSVFLAAVWTMLIVALAAIDDVWHLLPPADAVLYMLGLTAVCAVDYIVFSITTLYFIGYILLVIYTCFAISRYRNGNRQGYICGRCGAHLMKKGRCPYCGAINE